MCCGDCNGKVPARRKWLCRAGLTKVLERCFREEPTERWPSLADASEALRQVYREATGVEYSRSAPDGIRSKPAAAEYLRWTELGYHWDNPRDYLAEIFEAERHDPEAARRFLPPSTGTRFAQVLKDLAVFDEAIRCHLLINTPEWRPRLARLLQEKAVVHHELVDWLGALPPLNQAIEILQEFAQQKQSDWIVDLARALMNKGITLYNLGRPRAAVTVYDQAILRLKPLIYDNAEWQWTNDLAKVYVNKANALDELRYVDAAGEFYDQSCQLRTWLIEEKGQTEILAEQARTFTTWASIKHRQGKSRDAVSLCDNAIRIFQFLRSDGGNEFLAYDSAAACLNKASALVGLQDYCTALDACDWAIVIYSRLLYQQHTDCRAQLAGTYFNKAYIFSEWKRPELALGWCLESAKLYQRLVRLEGRLDLQNELANAEQLYIRLSGGP
jgi:tetratricopeptide (TPR) repeat protein